MSHVQIENGKGAQFVDNFYQHESFFAVYEWNLIKSQDSTANICNNK